MPQKDDKANRVMSWQSASEIVCGFVLADKLNPEAVNLADVYPAYQHIVSMKRDGKDKIDIVTVDYAAVEACDHAAIAVNGTLETPIGYLKVLATAAAQAKITDDIEKLLKRAKSGEVLSAAEALALAEKMQSGGHRWIPMSQVEPQKVKFVKTGWQPLDVHTGGIPYACVTILASTAGVGKSTLALEIVKSMARLKENKKKKAAIVSLEMTMGQIHQRVIEISDMTNEEKDRMLLNRIFNIHELCAEVSALAGQEDLFLIMIDFADLLVEGEQSEAQMGVIYRNLELLATKTEVPILLVAQFSRETYKGGIPRINHIRYSSMAEITARMILMIYNPNVTVSGYQDKDSGVGSPLPPVPDKGYLIVGKSNFGYKEGKPGAIILDWDGEIGWGNKSGGYIPLAGG